MRFCQDKHRKCFIVWQTKQQHTSRSENNNHIKNACDIKINGDYFSKGFEKGPLMR